MWKKSLIYLCLMALFNVFGIHQTLAADTTIKVGALQFGTVNWLLDTIKNNQLDEKNGFNLVVTPLSGKDSSQVALQGGAVDVIVSDWLWVSRLRSEGSSVVFVPYSNAVGSLMVKVDSGINTVADLAGKKIGIAGGSVDKSWLLMRAYTQKEQGKDLKDMVEANFGAPPLLNELAQKGDVDGVITFWHYAARLKAAGFKSILELPDVLKTLGIERQLPLIGWVFDEKWAEQPAQREAMNGFLTAAAEAQRLLLDSDAEWETLRDSMKAEDDAIFTALRDAFRAGIPRCFGKEEIAASAQVFTLLAELGGSELVGEHTALDAGTFWSGMNMQACE